jgi:AcrR family transcriptional regulator
MTAARRGRPRSFDVKVALSQASDAFRQGGYASTSLDDIVRATGLNRPSLYAAFGDKKALYVAAIEALRDGIGRQFDNLAALDLPLQETLSVMFARSIDAYLSGPTGPRGCLAICTASAEAVTDAEIRTALADVLAIIDNRVGGFFARAGHPEPERHARLVAAVMHSISVRARAGSPRAILDQMGADAVSQFAGR